jgi:hypothetical protein
MICLMEQQLNLKKEQLDLEKQLIENGHNSKGRKLHENLTKYTKELEIKKNHNSSNGDEDLEGEKIIELE